MASSSTEAPTKRAFIVWISDRTDPDALTRRLAVRSAHLERIQRLAVEGAIMSGSPLSDPVSGQKNGSVLIIEAENAAAVRDVVEGDLYWTSNVWDKEKVDIRAVEPSIIRARA